MDIRMVYFRKDGTPTPYPTDRKLARSKKLLRYDAVTPCEKCDACTLRFVRNDACVHCQRLAALDFFNNNYEDPRTLEEALRRGEDFLVTWDMCSKAGHLGILTLDRRCKFCVRESEIQRDPARADARRAGQTWYTPRDACEKCHQKADRRVLNNNCRQCENAIKPFPDERNTASSVLMRQNPDMVMDRTTAISLALKVFRTGKPCHRGHSSWRYVSTRGCVECLSGSRA